VVHEFGTEKDELAFVTASGEHDIPAGSNVFGYMAFFTTLLVMVFSPRRMACTMGAENRIGRSITDSFLG
jgi:hypothetical protein